MKKAARRALAALLGTALALTSLIMSTPPASADSAPYSPCYVTYSRSCIDDEFGYTGQRPWKYPVDNWGNNCTNYASFRLDRDGVANPGNLGPASDWAANARAKGIAVDGTPTVGSIAQWVSGNHVAYVDWVSADGNQIAVSESGYDDIYPSMSGRSIINRSSTRVGSSPSYRWPDNFIRFRSSSFSSAPNPTVAGTAMVGMTLTASTGTWNPTPSFSYQWNKNGAAIGGATGSTYVVQIDDIGATLTVKVTGSKSGYPTTSRTSGPTSAVLMIDANGNGIDDTQELLPWNSDVNNDGRPDVVGFGGAGIRVALNTGTSFAPGKSWSNEFGYGPGGWRTEHHPRTLIDVNKDGKPDVVGFANAGVVVALNTGKSFAPAKLWIADFGATAGGWEVAKHPRTLVDVNNDGRPDVVGFGGAGIRVALNTGTGFAPAKSWIADFGAIAGGWQVASHPRSVSLVQVSGPTPKISGKAKAKSTLTAKPGTWKPAPVTLKYQWYRDGKAIKGATKSKYKLVSADKRKKIKVIVTGSKAGYASVSKASAAKTIAK